MPFWVGPTLRGDKVLVPIFLCISCASVTNSCKTATYAWLVSIFVNFQIYFWLAPIFALDTVSTVQGNNDTPVECCRLSPAARIDATLLYLLYYRKRLRTLPRR